MPTEYVVSSADWPRFRFAHSALFETMQAVRTLRRPDQQPLHRRWVASVAAAEVLAAIPALVALSPSRGPVWVPDFLAPPPRHQGVTDIAADLAVVARYPTRQVQADLSQSLQSQPSAARRAALEPLIAHPVKGKRQLLAELEVAWLALAQPFWPEISRLVSEDISYRSRRLAQHGLGRLLADLHPDVRLIGDRVSVAHNEPLTVPLAGRGLLLMPSAFLRPRPIAVHDAPWPPTLVYPARGVGNLWATPPRPSTALADLLGSSRAQLLLDLDEPRSTTTLAQRHRLSPAGTSAHLTRLTSAGLSTGSRVGREVRYRRTPLGDALVTAYQPPS